jgi:hypothetical protein
VNRPSKKKPHTPDGFIASFEATCPTVDPTVVGYMTEAVAAFNAGCTCSALLMLCCASEKLILLLSESFEAAISDAAKKATFARELLAQWPISYRYTILHRHLVRVADAKALPREHEETVKSELTDGYELLRRCRNSAGHPKVPSSVDAEDILTNLRMFADHARRVTRLIEYFATNKVDW